MTTPQIFHHAFEEFQFIEFVGVLTPRNFYLVFDKTSKLLQENRHHHAIIEAHPHRPSQVSAKISLVKILDDLEFETGVNIAWVTFNEAAYQSAKASEVILNGRGLFLAKAFQSSREALEWFDQDITFDSGNTSSPKRNYDTVIEKILERRVLKNYVEKY